MSDDYEYMPDMTRTHGGGAPPIGPLVCPTQFGDVPCEQMLDILASHITLDGEPAVVAIFVAGRHGGAYAALSPSHARDLAAAIHRSADAAEAGYGVLPQ